MGHKLHKLLKQVAESLASYLARLLPSLFDNWWDNAVVESFFGSLNTERVFFSNYKTRWEAKRDIVDYIEMFYNCIRRHSYLGYLIPKEFEKVWVMKYAA